MRKSSVAAAYTAVNNKMRVCVCTSLRLDGGSVPPATVRVKGSGPECLVIGPNEFPNQPHT